MSALPTDAARSGVGTVQVTMPDLGGARSADIVAWLKCPGEQVDAEEALCLVAWDGQRAEITAPAAGVLRMIAVGAGKSVATGSSLALIDISVRETGHELVPEPLLRDAPVAAPQRVELDTFLSPAVRRFARAREIDPSSVTGSGRGGRVTLDDMSKRG